MSSLYSARVSNSEASCAKSSSSSGSSFASTFLTSHWNTASLPASSFAWYSSGKVTLTSTCVSSFCSDQLIFKSRNEGSGTKCQTDNSVPLPPSNASPSTNPSKSIVTMSPFSAPRSSTVTVLEFFSCSFFSSASTSSSVTSTSVFGTSTPLYSPRVTSGFTATSAVKMKALPGSACVTSICG